jgi:simple sugar transport system permease protein
MLRIAKRSSISKRKATFIRVFGIFLSLVLMSIFLLTMNLNPLKVYQAMIAGCFGSFYRFKETIELMVPLSLAAVGIMIAFKMKFWNIGAEGQILMGAMAASFVALNMPDTPKVMLLILMGIASLIVGGLWAFIPAIFKVKFETNETLFTLMLNYIAIKFVIYLQYGPWKDPMALGFPKIPNFVDNALIPELFDVHIGWVILIIVTILFYVVLNKTKLGYEISVIGESQNTARYAGMNVNKVVLLTLFMSGAICGLVGMIQASGVAGTLTAEISGGMGYTAIIVAWLSQMQVHFVPVIGLLFAVLVQGASYIQTAFQIPQSAAEILQGIILFFALGSEFFINYTLHSISEKDEKSTESGDIDESLNAKKEVPVNE